MYVNEYFTNSPEQMLRAMLLSGNMSTQKVGITLFLPPPIHLLTNNTAYSHFRFSTGLCHLFECSGRTGDGMFPAVCKIPSALLREAFCMVQNIGRILRETVCMVQNISRNLRDTVCSMQKVCRNPQEVICRVQKVCRNPGTAICRLQKVCARSGEVLPRPVYPVEFCLTQAEPAIINQNEVEPRLHGEINLSTTNT
jgi:hypothetical protein